jgi:hypothetical protein
VVGDGGAEVERLDRVAITPLPAGLDGALGAIVARLQELPLALVDSIPGS